MAKSKLANANQRIAKTVTTGFQKMSQGVVLGYTKIEDKFVDQYLTKEGETIEMAKIRMQNEEQQRRDHHQEKANFNEEQ